MMRGDLTVRLLQKVSIPEQQEPLMPEKRIKETKTKTNTYCHEYIKINLRYTR